MSLRHLVPVACAAFLAASAPAQKLGIGDPAPALKIASWVKGEPVKSFEPARVYVVEFWATWCVPCRKSIPHLTDVQSKFAKDGVTLIAVSIWEDDPKLVQPFVDGLGDAMSYRVALDEVYEGAKPWQGTMSRTWMRAADEPSIPTAFIVDQTGRIAWIGNSLEIEQPLTQVLDGTWDLSAAKSANQRRVQVNQLQREFDKFVSARDWGNVASSGEKLEKLDPSRVYEIGPRRFQALLELGRTEEGYAYARKLVEGPFKDEALRLNWIAWIVVDPKAARKSPRDLPFALAVAKRADELTQHADALILDTLAVCYFESGEIAQALEIQEKAVRLAAGTKWLAELEQRLVRFREAAAKRSETDKLAVR